MADVVKTFTRDNDTTYVINFWATFCKPCVAEIPDLISVCRKFRANKVRLLLVSLDLPDFYPVKIRSFVKRRGFITHIAWLNETDADYFCPMIYKKWSGAIPATIIINNKTGYRQFFEEEMSRDRFEEAVRKAVGG